MVAAKIPAITIPARKGTKNSADINIKIFSESLCVRNALGKITLPIMPMAMAANKDIAHHTTAILLDLPSSLESLIAMNLISTWGIPKYPRPQERVDITVSNP